MPPSDESRTSRVYCAGPLFNRSERDEMTSIADLLCQAGYLVYLPHRDGMEFRRVLDVLLERGFAHKPAAAFLHAAIFALDVYQLAAECDAVVWNVNGRTPDEGAVAEAAIAWTLGKPLVAYADDVRSLIEGRMNPLLAGMVDFTTVDRLTEVPRALAEAFERHAASSFLASELPPKLRRAIDDGGRLWEAMCAENAQYDDEAIADVVVDLFAPAATL
jgi:nucleoside 2-deoxyribosyltransferase